ncbi:hypothetical protein BT63DRAFT_452304 [Microthyrium microscopicum]|uniref:CCHC-type domain-containing protein n=1 Tax=Microthyrium microscopicum TaxID=703497 RepID=A0A6A6UHP9_9PEZI|nr:hypothetical protein BT63DRAFT_452304 [Microthyrium microscopicum]
MNPAFSSANVRCEGCGQVGGHTAECTRCKACHSDAHTENSCFWVQCGIQGYLPTSSAGPSNTEQSVTMVRTSEADQTVIAARPASPKIPPWRDQWRRAAQESGPASKMSGITDEHQMPIANTTRPNHSALQALLRAQLEHNDALDPIPTTHVPQAHVANPHQDSFHTQTQTQALPNHDQNERIINEASYQQHLDYEAHRAQQEWVVRQANHAQQTYLAREMEAQRAYFAQQAAPPMYGPAPYQMQQMQQTYPPPPLGVPIPSAYGAPTSMPPYPPGPAYSPPGPSYPNQQPYPQPYPMQQPPPGFYNPQPQPPNIHPFAHLARTECATCRAFGHIYRNCPRTQCYGCWGFGHMSEDCPDRATNNMIARNECFRCKQVGHKVENCPLNGQDQQEGW